MSRSTSPVPRFISTPALPQQLTEESGELGNVSFSGVSSWPSAHTESFPILPHSYVMGRGNLGLPTEPPPMTRLPPQPSFAEDLRQDMFLPGSGLSLSPTLSPSPTVVVSQRAPSMGGFGEPRTILVNLPETMPMQSPALPSAGALSQERDVRVSFPPSFFGQGGAPPPTLPPSYLQAFTPTTLPTFPSIGPTTLPRFPSMGPVPGTLPPTSAVWTTGPQAFAGSPVGDPFKDAFFDDAAAARASAPDNNEQDPFLPRQAPPQDEPGNSVGNGISYVGSAVHGGACHAGAKLYDAGSAVYDGGNSVGNGISYVGSAVHGGACHAGAKLYDAGYAVYDGGDRGLQEIQEGNVGAMFIFLGFFGSLMLVLIPVWDGYSLLKDPMWMYMSGDVLPIVLIACSAAIPVIFLLTAILLLKCGRRSLGARSEQTLLNASVLFILLLGVMLVTISEPITQKALWNKNEFLANCMTSAKTRPLYVEYGALQKIRATPACASKMSVENCAGFKETPTSIVLKEFEEKMQCAGFCYYPTVGKAAATDLYPPALFTSVKYQGSCSAMAARNMESFVVDMSKQLMYEGFFLMAASILQGFMMILGLAAKKGVPKKAGYGTIQAPAEVVPPTDATLEPSAADFRRRQKIAEF